MYTYDLSNHLMVELKTIIALAIKTYIIETYLCELHPMNERLFNDFINNKQICLAKSTLAI